MLSFLRRDTLDAENIASIGDTLTAWITRLMDSGEGNLVLQKLTSALALYYMIPRVNAETCIRILLISFIAKNPPSASFIQSVDYPSGPFQILDIRQLTIALWFCKSLADQATDKITDSSSDVVASILTRMKINIDDAVTLIRHCLTFEKDNTSDGAHKLRSEALSAMLTWANFIQKVWPNDEDALTPMRSLVQPSLSWCAAGNDEALDTVSDLLSGFGTFFLKQHLEMISTLLTDPVLNLGAIWTEADDYELHPKAKFVLAFGDATVKDLAHHLDSPVTQNIMSKLLI
jgi:hypothetical protein